MQRTNRHFSKKGIQMESKHMKKCLVSLSIIKMLNIIRERHKTTMRFYFTPLWGFMIKKKEPPYIAGRSVKWYTVWNFFKC